MKKAGLNLFALLSISFFTYSQNINSQLTFDSVRALNEINDQFTADAFPWISNDGLRLYYTQGSLTIFMKYSERATINDPWSAPTILMSGIPTTGFTLSSNELELFQGSGPDLLHYSRPNMASPFTNQTIVNLNLPVVPYFVRSISFDASGFQMFAYVNSPGVNEIFELTKSGVLTYNFTRKIPIPPGYTSPNGRLSCDGLTFVYSLVDTLGNHELGFVDRATPFDTFNVATLTFLPELVDTSFLTSQASLSSNNDWIVFARGITNSFAETNLYIASKTGVINSVSENMQLHDNVYPNPATDILNFKFKGKKNVSSVLKIVGIDGKQFLSKNIYGQNQFELDISQLNSGLYFYSITSGNEFYQDKFVVLK